MTDRINFSGLPLRTRVMRFLFPGCIITNSNFRNQLTLQRGTPQGGSESRRGPRWEGPSTGNSGRKRGKTKWKLETAPVAFLHEQKHQVRLIQVKFYLDCIQRHSSQYTKKISERRHTNVVTHCECLLCLQRPMAWFCEEEKDCCWEEIQHLLQRN